MSNIRHDHGGQHAVLAATLFGLPAQSSGDSDTVLVPASGGMDYSDEVLVGGPEFPEVCEACE